MLQAKYEAVAQENNKLLQVTKELQMKIKALEEKQAEILLRTSVSTNFTQFRITYFYNATTLTKAARQIFYEFNE